MKITQSMIFWFGKTKSDINQVLRLILAYCTVFFSAGLIFDLVLYMINDNWPLAALNTGSVSIIVLSVILYFTKRLTPNGAIFFQVLAIALNILLSVIHEALSYGPRSEAIILMNMCIYIVPVILSALTRVRFAPLILTLAGLITYTAAALLTDDGELLDKLPIMVLIFIGAPIALVNVISVTNRMERENARVVRQQEELLQLLGIDPQMVELIQTGGLSRKQTAQILDKVDRRILDSVVSRVRNVITNEEKIIGALKKRYPLLTASEIEVSYLIVEGKTVSEICEIRHVGVSTVTSIRSRLRKKLGLKSGESLQSHLRSVVNNSL